jgi:Flp pilus assembly pilin Flp
MLKGHIRAFAGDQSGAVALEHKLAIAIIGTSVLFIVTQLGVSLSGVFSTIADAVFG